MPTLRSLAAACALAIAAWGGLASGAAAAGGRMALVVANAAYPDNDAVLPTPINDARALADELKRGGFTVVSVENASREAMQGAIDKFARGVEPDGIALVYFGGYGIQAGRKNYLVPVDARIWTEADVSRDGIAVDGLFEELAKRRAGIQVAILDASRRNPFERRFRTFSQGLAAPSTQSGTLTLYAAAAGALVSDGSGPKSPFMTELLQQLGSDQSIDQAFAAARDALAKRTRNAQVPAVSVNLEETFSLDPNRPRTAVKKTPRVNDNPEEPKQGRKEVESPVATEQKDFDAARAKGTRVAYQDFLDRYPNGQLADRARAEMSRLSADEAASTAFDAAEAKGTAAAYQDFLDRYPTGQLSDRARVAMDRIARSDRQRDDEERANTSERRRKDEERLRLTELDERIRRNPRDEDAYYARGQFHAQRGDYAAALRDFDEAIRLNPNSPEAYNNRCWVRAMADDLKRALTDCNRALQLRPGFLDALDSRGLVNLKSGSLRAAIADYGEALQLDPRHPSALYGRGLARKRLGENAQAVRDMASAREINPQIEQDFTAYGLR